jgi:uncharacterized protein
MSSKLIGKGIIFPVVITSGKPVVESGNALVQSSIKLILGWPIKDRFFKSQYGARLEELLEEPNDDILKSLAEYFVYSALTSWEPRIIVKDVTTIKTDPEKLSLELTYVIVESNKKESFIYPFYKNRLI